MITVNEFIEMLEALPDEEKEMEIERVEFSWVDKDDIQILQSRPPNGTRICIG